MTRKGDHLTEETKRKLSQSLKGKGLGNQNGHWKGDNACYVAKHMRRGIATHCEVCDTKSARWYHWANLDHKYSDNIDDWAQLCPSCHRKYDSGKIKVRGLGIVERGATLYDSSAVVRKGWEHRSRIGKPCSPEKKERLRLLYTGRPLLESTKIKIREAALKRSGK